MAISLWLVQLLFCVHVSLSINRQPHKSKVLVLGAGMAGIKAAEVLQSHGLKDFIILEGSNRIGGRLFNAKLRSGHSVNVGAKTVNQGGNWVQGLEGRQNFTENPIWTLAKSCNLSTKLSDFDDNIYFIEKTGQYLNESSSILEETWEKIGAAEDIISRNVILGRYAGKYIRARVFIL
jgi:polyamine oxidase